MENKPVIATGYEGHGGMRSVVLLWKCNITNSAGDGNIFYFVYISQYPVTIQLSKKLPLEDWVKGSFVLFLRTACDSTVLLKLNVITKKMEKKY